MEDTIFRGDGEIGEEIKKILDAQRDGVTIHNNHVNKICSMEVYELVFPQLGERFFETCIEAGKKIAQIGEERLKVIQNA